MTATTRELRVRAAFAAQARLCAQLGSPFTALLCATLAERLNRDTTAGAAILDWEGDPDARADSLPLRVAGALHALVRAGVVPGLAALYPDAKEAARVAKRSGEALYREIETVLTSHAAVIVLFLRRPPQTNEVGRSAALAAGLLTLADRFGKPIVLYEIGASAGLNLIPDRYYYRFGAATWGSSSARLQIAPQWQGLPPPTEAKVAIMLRRGCDASPLDLADESERQRLLAYVWAGQPERLSRLEAAIETARSFPPAVDRLDAARWLEARLGEPPPPNALVVIWHSIVWGYLDARTQARIEQLINDAGAAASAASPLAWLRYEIEPANSRQTAERIAGLRLTVWPKGESSLLALGHPHGSQIEWRGG